MKKQLKRIIGQIVLQYFPKQYTTYVFRKKSRITWDSVYTNKDNPETLFTPLFLDQNSVFFDVGTNKGMFIWLVSQYIPQKNIYAFEPIPSLFKRLKRMFPEANIFNVALSNEENIHEFKIPIINGKTLDSRGTLKTSFIEENETASSLIEVKTERLDYFLSQTQISKIDFIKIDVEGFEENVIVGAEKTIQKFKPILMVEIEQRHHKNSIIEIILNFTRKHKYSCFYFNSDLKHFVLFDTKTSINEIQDLQNLKVNQAEYINNFFFIPDYKANDRFMEEINARIPKN